MYENINNESILLFYAAAHQKIKILIITCFLRSWWQSSFHSREAEVTHGPCAWLAHGYTGNIQGGFQKKQTTQFLSAECGTTDVPVVCV